MIEPGQADLYSLLYVSHCRLVGHDASMGVLDIVGTSTTRNACQEVTGALLFTGEHFAQVLEGREHAVVELMTAISHDSRHDRILIVNKGPISGRRFADWSLAYFGPSRFVSDHVSRLLDAPSPAEQHKAAKWLEHLLMEFAKPGKSPDAKPQQSRP